MPTRKLGRPTDHRRAMLRAMVTFLLEKGSIETTVTRAKEVSAIAEQMITLGKENTLHAKRQAMTFITKEDVVKKLFDEIAPQYAEISGGYTRIYKTGPRRGDAAEMSILALTKHELVPAKAEKKTKKEATKAEPKTTKEPKAGKEAKETKAKATKAKEPKAE